MKNSEKKSASAKGKVVVTGGAGFIGSHVTDALVQEGYDVHVIDNLSNGSKENIHKNATLHQVDICHLDEIRSVIAGAKFVFHLAALPRVQYSIKYPIESNDANVNGTLNVLIAAKEGGVERVIYSASSSAYGDQSTMPLREAMIANPKSPYGLQKYVGELYCRVWTEVYNLPTVSLRYFSVYGPRQRLDGAYSLVIGTFLTQVRDGKPMTITGDGEQTRDFTHVRDIVRANMLAMKSKKVGHGEVINIGAGDSHSVNHIANLIGGEVEYIPARFEPKNTLADNSLARKLLGWKPEVDIGEGIAELKKSMKIKNKANDEFPVE